jgi:hypothetical protein
MRLEKGKDHAMFMPVIAHILALAGVGGLAFCSLLPLLNVPMFVLLICRAVFGLSEYRTRMKAMTIGVWEVVYGVLTALSLIIGYHIGI